jgi:hypothetical protein
MNCWHPTIRLRERDLVNISLWFDEHDYGHMWSLIDNEKSKSDWAFGRFYKNDGEVDIYIRNTIPQELIFELKMRFL